MLTCSKLYKTPLYMFSALFTSSALYGVHPLLCYTYRMLPPLSSLSLSLVEAISSGAGCAQLEGGQPRVKDGYVLRASSGDERLHGLVDRHGLPLPHEEGAALRPLEP